MPLSTYSSIGSQSNSQFKTTIQYIYYHINSLGYSSTQWSLLIANLLLRTISHKAIYHGKIVHTYTSCFFRMQLERLPCASLLVRVNRAPLSEDGLKVLNLYLYSS